MTRIAPALNSFRIYSFRASRARDADSGMHELNRNEYVALPVV